MTQPYGVRPAGDRLPDETHIGRVRLQVANLARSVSYYETIVGTRVLKRSETSAELGLHGDERVLIQLDEKKAARAVARRGLLGLYHFAILLPDRGLLGSFVEHLADIGA